MKIPMLEPGQAPEEARPTLDEVQERFGFLPHLMRVMATSPALLHGYLDLARRFDETSLSPVERQVVLLAASRSNACTYCMAAHSVIAKMNGVPDEVVAALREDDPIADPKLEALRRVAAEITATRGEPSAAALDAFEQAGYTPRQLLDVVLGVGMKTLSNYTNHLAHTPLDGAFGPAAWSAPETSRR